METNNESASSHMHKKVLLETFALIREKGLKATTMNAVANSLGISKRTLYEMFESKDNLLHECLEFNHNLFFQKIEKVYASKGTVIEALFEIFMMHLEFINSTSVKFFEDMDERFKHMRKVYNQNPMHKCLQLALEQGTQQGVFRNDFDFRIAIKLLEVQVEALKRTEEVFPQNVTLDEAYKWIVISFLRSVATPLGSSLLDSVVAKYS